MRAGVGARFLPRRFSVCLLHAPTSAPACAADLLDGGPPPQLTRAAEQLCITQGAVSRQIQTLEAHYGFPLFKRHAKGLTLTAEGEQLLPVVNESFARIEDISMRLTRQRTDLALKVPTCVMRWMLPRIMRFQGEHPDLHVQITTAWQHVVDFSTEPFDAAVVYGTSPGAGVFALPLFDERLTPVCAPELRQTSPLDAVGDLARHTLLHPTRDHRDWRAWLDHAGERSVDPARGRRSTRSISRRTRRCRASASRSAT